MNHIVEIWEYLANQFDNECLADEILSFFVEMKCNLESDDFENIASYPFMISFPGLTVCLKNNLRTQFENSLSMKFICNFDVVVFRMFWIKMDMFNKSGYCTIWDF